MSIITFTHFKNMKIKYLLSIGIVFFVIIKINAQPLKIISKKEGQGKYYAKSILIPPYSGKEIVMLTESNYSGYMDKVDATILTTDLDLIGEKTPIMLWTGQSGFSSGRKTFFGVNDNKFVSFVAKESSSGVSVLYSRFGNDVKVAPTTTELFSYKKIATFTAGERFPEDKFFMGGGLSPDKSKMGYVYFPEGNKGPSDQSSTVNVSCYTMDGATSWQKSFELPNEKRFNIRVLDVKTDDKGNIFALLNYVRFSSPNYISIGKFAFCNGPDFPNPELKKLEFSKSLIFSDQKTWVDNKGGYYILGAAKGEDKTEYNYFANLTADEKIEPIIFKAAINLNALELSVVGSQDSPFLMDTDGVIEIDENHFLVVAGKGDINAVIIDKSGNVIENYYIDYAGANGNDDMKSPFIKKIGNTTYLFFQGYKDKTTLMPNSKKQKNYTSYPYTALGRKIESENIVGKYAIIENGKLSKEYIIPDSDGFGVPSHFYELDNKTYLFFNRKGDIKKTVNYMLLEVQ